MDKDQLKRFLKFIKNHEESMSLLFGLLIVLGLMFGIGWYVSRSSRSAGSLPQPTIPIDIQPPQVEFPESLSTGSSIPLDISSNSGISSTMSSAPIHIVQPGEGLWQIAERYYGDGNKYVEIYEANRDVMRSIEDIRVGMRLRIP